MATMQGPGLATESSSDEKALQQLARGSDSLGSPDDVPSDPPNANPASAGAGEPEERTIRGLRWGTVLVSIFAANVLYGLDTTIAADIQAAVAKDLGHITELGWLGYGFGLGATSAILPLGKAFALFDTKWTYMLCLVMFAAGSALCGAAPSMGALVVGRVWAGVGGAGMYLGTLNILMSLTATREKPLYMSFLVMAYGGGCILGPVVGGLLADSSATWRWAFYLNLVVFGVTSPFYLFALPSIPKHADTPVVTKLRQLDWLGVVLSAAMYVCFVLAFSFGGTAWAWSDGRFVALVVLFGVFVGAFAATQRFAVLTTRERRLFPCEFLADPQMLLLYLLMACGGSSLFVAVYYIPLYFQFVHGDSGTLAAVRLLPFVSFYIAAVLACGYAMPRVGYAWVWYLASGLCLTAGGAAMYAAVDINSPPGRVYGFSLLLGLGLTTSQAGYSLAAARVAASSTAEAIQFLNIGQGSAQMLGLLIASAIFQGEAFAGLHALLADKGYSATQIREAVAGTQSTILDGMAADLRQQCLGVLVRTIQHEWIMIVAAGALMTVCACFLTKKQH